VVICHANVIRYFVCKALQIPTEVPALIYIHMYYLKCVVCVVCVCVSVCVCVCVCVCLCIICIYIREGHAHAPSPDRQGMSGTFVAYCRGKRDLL